MVQTATKAKVEKEEKTSLPQTRNLIMRVGSTTSDDTQVDTKGRIVYPGMRITGQQFHEYLKRQYIDQNYQVTGCTVLELDGDGTVNVWLTLHLYSGQGSRQVDVRLLVRPEINPANVLYLDQDMNNLLQQGFEQVWASGLGVTKGGANVAAWFVKYE
jgi:hypothetical protein